MSARVTVADLGRQRYGRTLELQRALCRQRMSGELAQDVLLLVEHDPVVTLGRGTRATSLPIDPAGLRRRGVEVAEVERGGDVTYHGPGQLVGYPIMQLQDHRPDLHWYLRQLEAALMAALARLGVAAERREGLTGVWTKDRKIASIGIHVKQWVTFHGFALNVSTDLRGFDLIVPCGIHGVTMTSVASETGRADGPALRRDVRDHVIHAFMSTFGYVGADHSDRLVEAATLAPAAPRR